MSGLNTLLERAIQVRADLLGRLQAEGTDCWRVFHGVAEGRPGLAVDRYGPLLLVQLFHGDLEPEDLHALEGLAEGMGLRLVLWHRGQGRGAAECHGRRRIEEVDSGLTCCEEGQRFAIAERSPGLDPWLFLDFRAARRWLRAHVPAEASVLNLFAYTCSAGVSAGRQGAEVWNVDFGRWCLEIGSRNRELNGLDPERFHFWREDVFPILWQLSGKGVRGRAAQRPYLRVEPRLFDVVILDPPTLARSPFGKVDLVADYPAMLKPCLLALRPGGRILATNHAAGVDREAWEQVLRRTAEKAGRELLALEFLAPEEDFPSPDGQPPLKIAVLSAG